MADALGLKFSRQKRSSRRLTRAKIPAPPIRPHYDEQIATKQIRVFIYNSQNATPDVNALRDQSAGGGYPYRDRDRDDDASRSDLPGMAGSATEGAPAGAGDSYTMMAGSEGR